MGFADDLLALDEMRNNNATHDELIEAFPDALLDAVGVYATPDEAQAKFAALAEGLDIAIVRVVNARPGIDATRAVMQACAPGR
jgi:hypothetical protein